MKKWLVFLAVVVMAMGFAVNAFAWTGWIEGTIKSVNRYPASVNIVVNRTTPVQTVGAAVATANVNQILAIALTAASSGQTVSMYFDGTQWTGISLVP